MTPKQEHLSLYTLSHLSGLAIRTKKRIVFVDVRQCLFNVLYIFFICPAVIRQKRSRPANLELNLKWSEIECAGYTCSVVVRCVFVILSVVFVVSGKQYLLFVRFIRSTFGMCSLLIR